MAKKSAAALLLSSRLRGFDAPTVWHEFTSLASEQCAVNLGQGFPDWPTPDFIKRCLVRAVEGDFNQYTRSGGHVPLVEALSAHYTPVYWDTLGGRAVDPLTEITISVGATEGLFAAMQALLAEGDEVVVLEPAFDIYPAQIQMAGGVTRCVPLRRGDGDGDGEDTWQLDMEEFAQTFTDKTRMLILNNPHNPTGKVFTQAELERIAEVVQRFPRVVCVCDEVYENMVFDGKRMARLANVPNMWERTLSISSAGKTFSVTGWKVGWAVGPADLVRPLMLANQWVQFSVPTVTQHAVALALEEARKPYEGAESYFAFNCQEYQRKRDFLVRTVEASSLNLRPIVPEGGMFLMVGTENIAWSEEEEREFMSLSTDAKPVMSRDWAICRWLTERRGVAAIPPSSFFTPDHASLAHGLIRLAFCKTDDALEKAAERLC